MNRDENMKHKAFTFLLSLRQNCLSAMQTIGLFALPADTLQDQNMILHQAFSLSLLQAAYAYQLKLSQSGPHKERHKSLLNTHTRENCGTEKTPNALTWKRLIYLSFQSFDHTAITMPVDKKLQNLICSKNVVKQIL